MFLTRLWFSITAILLVLAVTIGMAVVKPIEKEKLQLQTDQLQSACHSGHLWLANYAETRVNQAAFLARNTDVIAAADAAESAPQITEAQRDMAMSAAARARVAEKENPPDFIVIVDKNGRAVAREGDIENEYGDSMLGRPLVDDALSGFVRDDIWTFKDSAFWVSAAPIVAQGRSNAGVMTPGAPRYAGALVVGHKISDDMLAKLAKQSGSQVAVFYGNKTVGATEKARFDAIALIPKTGVFECSAATLVEQTPDEATFQLVATLLPGEPSAESLFLTFYQTKADTEGVLGALKKLQPLDLMPHPIVLGILGAILLTLLLMAWTLPYFESGRHVRRLQKAASALAQGTDPRLEEEKHHGRYGAIAKSINVAIDKLTRETKSARNDFDQLLTGAAANASVGVTGLSQQAPNPMPIPAAGGDDFSLEALSKKYEKNDLDLPPPPTANIKQASKMPAPLPAAGPMGGGGGASSFLQGLPPALHDDEPNSEVKATYEEYIRTKQSCGENTTGLTIEKFALTLEKNRNQLMQQTGCKAVKFSVYIKDGKAALRATPVR